MKEDARLPDVLRDIVRRTDFGALSREDRDAITEAADAISDITKRLEEAKEALAPFAAKARAFNSAYLLQTPKVDIIVDGAALLLAAELHALLSRDLASERQLPRDPLANDPANGDERAPRDSVKRGFD